MLFLEAFVKFGAIGLLIAVGLLIARDGRDTRALRFSLPLIIALCCLFMTTGSPSLAIPNPWAIPLRLFDCLNSIFIWWLGLGLFKDDFELGKREWIVAAAYAIIALPLRMHYLGFDVYYTYTLNLAVSAFMFGLMSHLCYLALHGRKEDLVEERRRMRVGFIVAVALVAIASVLAERIAGYVGLYEQETIWITYIFTFILTAWSVLWLARLHPEVLAFDSKGQITRQESDLDPHDQAVYRKVLEVMNIDRAFTSHGLSIGDLAEKVGVPAHQLRKLINQTMGHRNFSSFLNSYRIAEVKKSLCDPENARIPVLTLAMDAGFSSLAPFNRAFKSSEGITPSDFRTQNLAKNANNPVQN